MLKGPLRDKGAKRPELGGGPAPGAFPAIANAREAAHWLQVLEAERSEVLEALHTLQQRFEAEVGAPAARLMLRRSGGLIWRLRAAAPSGQTPFELTSVTGRSLLQSLPPRLRRVYLNAEAERLRLNARYRIANTATRCLAHYLDRYGQVRALRKSSETK